MFKVTAFIRSCHTISRLSPDCLQELPRRNSYAPSHLKHTPIGSMHMKILYTLAAVGLAAGLTMAEARAGKTLHVEIWGQNNPSCGSESNPCRALGYTVSQRANPKDRLVVGPGD